VNSTVQCSEGQRRDKGQRLPSALLTLLAPLKVLMIQGFLAARKAHERLLLLVRMLARNGAAAGHLPCFRAGERSVMKGLERRLALPLTEVQVSWSGRLG
jgi:hypothetical protein